MNSTNFDFTTLVNEISHKRKYTTYTFDLGNKAGITSKGDMDEKTFQAIDVFIEFHMLPSFVYPEIYNFMVFQRKVEVLEDEYGCFFDFNTNVSENEVESFVECLRKLDREKRTFFQLKNSGAL